MRIDEKLGKLEKHIWRIILNSVKTFFVYGNVEYKNTKACKNVQKPIIKRLHVP